MTRNGRRRRRRRRAEQRDEETGSASDSDATVVEYTSDEDDLSEQSSRFGNLCYTCARDVVFGALLIFAGLECYARAQDTLWHADTYEQPRNNSPS